MNLWGKSALEYSYSSSNSILCPLASPRGELFLNFFTSDRDFDRLRIASSEAFTPNLKRREAWSHLQGVSVQGGAEEGSLNKAFPCSVVAAFSNPLV